MSLLLTLNNITSCSVSIVNFEQVNAGWGVIKFQKPILNSEKLLKISKPAFTRLKKEDFT